nr:toll/interleukin-1 receptor domain-containing protein [Oscillospiraceae bacterium]
MSRFFKPYEGKRPYIFISYAHLQSETVVDTIRILYEKGYRLWYDEGIPAGSDWPANIAQHMQGCERVIFFLSERAMESPNCYSEMRTACRLGKPVLIVRLEDTEPSA